MTILNLAPSTRLVTATASASQTVFSINFDFQDNADIVVQTQLAAGGDWSTLTEGVDYTLTGANGVGDREVTLTSGATEDDKYRIVGAAVLERTGSVTANGIFNPALTDAEFVRILMIVQELARDMARAVKADYGTAGAEFPAPEADKLLGWNDAGDALENVGGLTDSVAAAAASATAAGDSATAAADSATAAGNSAAAAGDSATAAAAAVAAAANYTPAGTGAVERTVAGKLQDRPAVTDFGAVADGSTDSTGAVNTAKAAGFESLFVPEGTGSVLTTLANYNAIPTKLLGPGQIETTAGKLPPFYSHADGPRASLGTHSSMLAAFDGDLSGSIFQVGQSVRNGALGEPSSGYLFTPEVALSYHYTVVSSTAGHNEETDGNDGRTGYVQNRSVIVHQGNGDAIAHHASVSVSGQKAGATHFLAQPAAVLYGGSVIAGNDNTNLTLGEMSVKDQGYDCRGSGFVLNFTRNEATGSNEAYWSGIRLNSNGSQECEAAFQAAGNWHVGLDFTAATLGGTPIALKQGQRIEFNASSTVDSAGIAQYADTLNQWDMGYDGTYIALRVGGSNRLLFATSNITLANSPVTITDAGGLNLSNASGALKVAGTQVVNARKAGWAVATGTATRTTFATGSVTLSGLAERVKALIDDLHATAGHGLIGA